MTAELNKNDKVIIWGAGYCGGIALEAYGKDSVLCFGDSDERNIGHERWGKIIISFERMIEIAKSESIRIIAASEDYGEEMKRELIKANITNYDLFRSEYARVIVEDKRKGISPIKKTYDGYVSSLIHPELEKFKDIYSGKRVFIIGNGPSLKPEDLDVLYDNHEICFGFNNIYKIFNRTKWRPDYYSVVDFYSFLLNRDLIQNVPGIHFLWDIFEPWMNAAKKGKNYYFHYERKRFENNPPNFAEDITNGTHLGYSSVYDVGLQFAAYMGASEIYLLGVDHNYPNKISHEGNHFDGYMDADEKKVVFYPVENISKGYEEKKVELAFFGADEYSKKHGFRVYNATRGGKLEVFERVDFDSLF